MGRNYRQMGLRGNLVDIGAIFSDVWQSSVVTCLMHMRRMDCRRVTEKKGRRIKGAFEGGKVAGLPAWSGPDDDG
jgi:hypothetical protein